MPHSVAVVQLKVIYLLNNFFINYSLIFFRSVLLGSQLFAGLTLDSPVHLNMQVFGLSGVPRENPRWRIPHRKLTGEWPGDQTNNLLNNLLMCFGLFYIFFM